MQLRVSRSAAAALGRGHPWVYRDAIHKPPRNLEPGAPVTVSGDTGAVLGHGYWDPESPIAVRIVSPPSGEPFSPELFAAVVEAAIRRRDGWFDDQTTAYRLCNGEGDRAPGFVLDRYGDVGVVRLDTAVLEPMLQTILARLGPALSSHGVGSVLQRRTHGAANEPKVTPAFGPETSERVVVREHGMRMEVDLAHGQKTGAFLDQRENRRRVRALARGRTKVLNLFSYAGGFSVAAALGGAGHVTSVDLAVGAHASAERSFRENGLDPRRHAFVASDAFVFLERAREKGERYDLVISDPPSFAPNARSRDRALGAYKKLHGAIGRVLAPSALFCAASCSSHITPDDFVATLDDAALGRSDLVLLELHGQPSDHPTSPAWPEGRYLKFAVLG